MKRHTKLDILVKAIQQLLHGIGENTDRQGIQETPERVAKAWMEWTSGYNQNLEDIFKTFEDGGESYNQMITVINIPFYSHCEHHLAPFFGQVSIAYIPDGKIIGLSKLSRLVGVFARRLQVQERMTQQIAESLQEHLQCLGCGVYVKARHLCMESRGISQQGQETITTSLQGVFLNADVRSEFLTGVRNER